VDHQAGTGDPATAARRRSPASLVADLAGDLQAADSGVDFVYRCLDRLMADWQLRDAVIVVDRPPFGRQAFRAARRPLAGGWAQDVALGGEAGLHTDPPVAADADVLAPLLDLVVVALRLDTLRYDSLHDPLTGLYNRRSFDDQLARAVGRARRYDSPFTLVLIDLDHFKAVNDEYGHPAGDEVLRAIGEEMRRTLRSSDVAARYGGDEFALILPEADSDLAPRLVDRLRDGVRALRRELPVDFSTGLASCPDEADSVEGLTKLADDRLYQAKGRRGREPPGDDE
jgi:diguanylate cyclase (GGDEF)-like protein